MISTAIHSTTCGKVFTDEWISRPSRFSTVSPSYFQHGVLDVESILVGNTDVLRTTNSTTSTTVLNFLWKKEQ